MAVLGQAIARHLSSLKGLYFVELPEALASEMVSLVQQANSAGDPRRALFVSSGPANPAPDDVTIHWRDILAWRTDEDRVFVWQRGLHEPDSSFQSVVRPFISRRFPGTGGGECSLAILVGACVRELWERRHWPPNGDVFDAFRLTAEWVTEVLYKFFEAEGNTPGQHWSDRFLTHFASMFDNLHEGLDAFAGPLVPRHAWEVVRLSGIPLPSVLLKDGNSFGQCPKRLPAKEMKNFTDLWKDIVENFLLSEGGPAEFLSALDAEAVGDPKISPWRDLNWAGVQELPPDAPAPVVGAAVFASSPTILSDTIPSTSAPTRPSWWGVTTDDLGKARSRLSKSPLPVPDPARRGFLCLWAGANATYVLDTRTGTVTHHHTPTKWRARVALTDLGLRYKGNWQALFVSQTEPPTGAEEDAWVNPQGVTLEMKDCTLDQQRVTASAGEQLQVLFNLLLEYSVRRDRTSQGLSGTWSPSRKLKVEIPVRLRHAGSWDAERKVEAEILVMIPSPFAPTVFVTNDAKLEAVGPDSEDTYSATTHGDSTQWAATTPTIMLSEEGRYGVLLYDGSLEPRSPAFRALAVPSVGETALPAPTGAFFPQTDHNLDNNVVVSDAEPTHGGDVAVFQVKQRSTNVSSGILSAVRRQQSRPRPLPSTAQTVLGQYQDHVTPKICEANGLPLDSLYQFVIGASELPITWEDHPGGPAPLMLFQRPNDFVLPGITNGPSAELIGCPEWGAFMAAMGQACHSLGLRPGGAEVTWLSSIDPSKLPAAQLRVVLEAHRALVSAAATPADRFWASYPFSVLVVEATQVDLGLLKAVFLSPLHPVRLAWGFAVASVAKGSGVDHGLLGLLEGWNLPAAGVTPTRAGQHRWLVAVPIDPGAEQDFVGWSALAVLGSGDTADLPLVGAGQALPWGGKTGINSRVVERSLKDYLAAHPHINALVVDIRSVGGSPRSVEIDDTLLRLLGGAELDQISDLGGGTKVWDSLDRHGRPPTRDDLLSKRRSQEAERSFEWRVYPAASPPSDADIALVENATVHLSVSRGRAHGVVGLLPLRRFFTADRCETVLDQNFLPRDGEDVLGLASLLRVLESPEGEDSMLCIRAMPQMHALGIGMGAKWEVIGTFNIDPSLLATLVATAPTAAGERLLWEWRPSWMVAEKGQADLARRPYYVIASVPASLTKALNLRQQISQENAAELLGVLGQFGFGLAALNVKGSTQESAAAGFFYAIQLLRPSAVTTPFAPENRPLIYGVLPLDPVEPMLQGLAGRPLGRRADMLTLAVSRGEDRVLRLCIVPVEVKHHGLPISPGPLQPPTNDKELKRARDQLKQTAELLREIIGGIAGTSDDEAGQRYLMRLALATLVDLAMSFSPAPPDADLRSEILTDLLGGPLEIGVGDPILLWFAPGSTSSMGSRLTYHTEIHRIDDITVVREVYMDPSALPGLWWSGVASGTAEPQARAAVDHVVRLSFGNCVGRATSVPSNRDDILRLLGLATPVIPTTPADSPQAPPADTPPTPPPAAEAAAQPAEAGAAVPAVPVVPPTQPQVPDHAATTLLAPPSDAAADAVPLPQSPSPASLPLLFATVPVAPGTSLNQGPPESAAFEGNSAAIVDAAPPEPGTPATANEPSENPQAVILNPASHSPVIPPQVRQKFDEAFNGFIGNDSAVKRIRRDLLSVLIENPPFLAKNYLITGQPSTGKTEIARRIATALGLPFVKMDGRAVQNRERLFELISGELDHQERTPLQVGDSAGLPMMQYPPLVVFIDEVHTVKKQVQESLLTMLEAKDRTVALTDHIAIMDKATFLFATTRASGVDGAFRTRCVEVELNEYELDDVAEIIRRHMGSQWPAEVYTKIAILGRRVPRIALELANELKTELAVTDNPHKSILEHLEEVRANREIDELGLTMKDIVYLQTLHAQDRAVGQDRMLNMLGTEDEKRILEEVEPFLKRIGFIRYGDKGREITPEGTLHVLSKRQNS